MEFDQEPDEEEILRALNLTRPQFNSGYGLAATPKSLSGETLREKFGISDAEIDQLVQRKFIFLAGDHFHATRFGAEFFIAVSGWIAPDYALPIP
jgi:hypothetical protein